MYFSINEKTKNTINCQTKTTSAKGDNKRTLTKQGTSSHWVGLRLIVQKSDEIFLTCCKETLITAKESEGHK